MLNLLICNQIYQKMIFINVLFQVGPKQRNFKVKDKDEYEFKPQETVSDISQIYLNLEEDVNFCIAVVNDGRSYSDDLFPKAINVLKKIHKPASMLENMENLHLKNQVN